MRRNPPEQPLSQISILKNLLHLSPLNNNGVEFRGGHLASMLLAFVDRGLMERLDAQSEADSCWFFVMRLVLANVHEHTYAHPFQASFANVPRLQVYKSKLDLKPIDGFVKQVLEMLPKMQGGALMRTGFKLLTDLVTSTPARVVSDLTVSHLVRSFPSIRLCAVSAEIESGSKASVHLAAFSFLEALLKRTAPFPVEMMRQFVQANLVGSLFQALDYVYEQRDMNQISEEDASLWIQRCWKLLTALVTVSRTLQKTALSTQNALSDMEEQFVTELVDPFNYNATDAANSLASLNFLTVYLDGPQCLLYDQVHVFLRLLRWLREILNRSWNQREMDLVVAALNVVAAVCGHVTDASFSVVQSFIDGLLLTLGWIAPEDIAEHEPESDRTIPISAGSVSDWMNSNPGPSRPPTGLRHFKKTHQTEPEIQPDDDSNASTYSISPSRSLLRAVQSHVIEVSPRSSLEEARSKLELLRARQRRASVERREAEKSKRTFVIPPLDLAALNMVKEWHQGRRSVASTVYSSEYPMRPLSQISDLSGILSNPEVMKLQSSLVSLDSEPSVGPTPIPTPSIFSSDLYNESPPLQETSMLDTVPDLVLNPNLQRVKYFHQPEKSQSSCSRESFEVESSVAMCSRKTLLQDEKRLSAQISAALEKRSNSTSAVDDMVAAAPRVSVPGARSASLTKVHSFDKRRSRGSLAMQHLVGDLSQTNTDADSVATPQTKRHMPNIVFYQESDDRAMIQCEIIGDDASGTAITVYAGSESTEAKELELEAMFLDIDEGSLSDLTVLETQRTLVTKYHLSSCETILDHQMVHASVLKTLLRFLAADYQNKNRERALTKVVSLGLHRHFHFVPRPILMVLKDWAIRTPDRSCYTLLKSGLDLIGFPLVCGCRMLAKQLFNENLYPSLRRIGRGVFSSIHECSCPVIGGPSTCCVKVIDLPKDPYGMRSMKDLFMELAIMQRLQPLPQVVRLYDFGTTEDNLYMVMKLYWTDLLSWRLQIAGPVVRGARMMFKIFAEILKSVTGLHEAGVVHFDLKSSNVLLDPRDDTSSMYDWQDNSELPFRIVLADFGEAMLVEKTKHGLMRSRGTQAFMSPEMLISGSSGKRVTPGIQSDAWSLGCLLFELMTGAPLFDDSDYCEFHTRLTTTSRTLIDASKVELIPEGIREPVLICLSYLLVRNPLLRAPLHAVAEWVEHLLATDALPESGSMVSTEEAQTSKNLRGFENTSFLPEPMDLEIRKECLPLSPNVSLLSFAVARDPWLLSEHRITHIVFVHLITTQSSEALRQIRDAALRANGLLFEVQISVEEENSILSWTDHCHRCCDNVLLSCQSTVPCQIAIVAGKSTGQYLKLMARYLTQQTDVCMNLDSALLV